MQSSGRIVACSEQAIKEAAIVSGTKLEY